MFISSLRRTLNTGSDNSLEREETLSISWESLVASLCLDAICTASSILGILGSLLASLLASAIFLGVNFRSFAAAARASSGDIPKAT